MEYRLNINLHCQTAKESGFKVRVLAAASALSARLMGCISGDGKPGKKCEASGGAVEQSKCLVFHIRVACSADTLEILLSVFQLLTTT